MDIFKNKKILFFAPKFFNYEIEIKNKLEKLGAEVDYYDERMNADSFTKIAIRLNKKIISKKIDEYYKNIIEKSKEKKYDYVFFLSPETITRELIQELKNIHKDSKYILYMYDSIRNKKNAREILDYFDSHFSFDKNDCQIDSRFKFRPLFYLDEYAELSQNKNLDYDLSFIGTAHSDRYRIVKALKTQAEKYSLKSYFFMYFPSEILYYFKKLTDRSYKDTDKNDFSFKGLSKVEVLDKISKSKAIIDVQHPNQSGLTMRTLEMVGMKKKLITTNKDIANYDFYNPKNIYILDRENPKLDTDFLKSEYENIDEKTYKKYSIGSWLEEIFGK